MNVLIVDDSAVIRKAIQKHLARHDLVLAGEAPNGLVALERYRAIKPDLVTLDITMPGMDGLTCMNEILKFDPNAKILIITALRDEATEQDALRRGAIGFLPKPFTPEQLGQALTKLKN